MGSALNRDFTQKNMITHVVLDAQMNLTLSHTTTSVPGCTTCLLLSGDVLQYCHRNHFLYDLVTRLFMHSLQYGIVVLGFFDAFVYAHHKHRQGSENPGNFCDCMKGRIRFVTAITQRIHTEEHDQTCRVGCPNEPDALTHYNECPKLYNIFFLSGDLLRYFLDRLSLLTKPSIWNRGTGLL